MQEEVTQKTVTFCIRATKITAEKDKSKEPPVYLVFFKGRDQDALNAAFREFSQKQIQKANKPSIHKRLAAYRAMMPKKTKDKVKNRHQEQSR